MVMLKLVSTYPRCYRQVFPGAPKLYLSSGIHGDERSGPITLMKLINEPGMFTGLDVTILPTLNPYGLEHNQRENENGMDRNRDFADQRDPMTRAHVALMTMDYDIALCFHEATTADGVYTYKPGANKNFRVLNRMVNAMSEVMPLDTRHKDLEIRPGIMKDIEYKEVHQTEAIYMANHGVDAFTIEVPTNAPMDLREKTIRRGILEAIAIISNK